MSINMVLFADYIKTKAVLRDFVVFLA